MDCFERNIKQESHKAPFTLNQKKKWRFSLSLADGLVAVYYRIADCCHRHRLYCLRCWAYTQQQPCHAITISTFIILMWCHSSTFYFLCWSFFVILQWFQCVFQPSICFQPSLDTAKNFISISEFTHQKSKFIHFILERHSIYHLAICWAHGCCNFNVRKHMPIVCRTYSHTFTERVQNVAKWN